MSRRRRDYTTELPPVGTDHITVTPPAGLENNKAWLIDQAYRHMQAAEAEADWDAYTKAENRVNQLLDHWDNGADCE